MLQPLYTLKYLIFIRFNHYTRHTISRHNTHLPHNNWIYPMQMTMKKIVLVAALAVLGGCATSSTTTERLDALENQLAGVQRTADQALEIAREARSASASASDAAGEAQRLARQAMDEASEASERAQRIGDECCGNK